MIEARYNHTKEQSAGFLRQALALMSKQDAAVNPITYAIWYEYASQVNTELNRAIDQLLDEDKVINDKTVCELYRQYLIEPQEEKVENINNDIQNLVTKLAESAQTTGESANNYSSALDHWVEQAGVVIGDNTALHEIMQSTSAMKDSVNNLKSSLDESQKEIERLRSELSSVREEAITDSLTQMLNRNGFKSKLNEMLGDDGSIPEDVSLMVLDIDHFKRINDNFGHLFGDKVIQAVAKVISTNLRGDDLGVRYGGEEFLVYLPRTLLESAKALAEKIRHSIESSRIKNSITNDVIERITISVGIASQKKGESLEQLIERADKALYESKGNGRNRVTAALS